ncbi:MAG: integrase arm-type DNA-binding domain-containing protein [Hyphomicrobiaceae bacterium]
MAQLHKLNARKVQSLTNTGRYGDGGGLYLDVRNGGRRRWIFRYRDRQTGKLRDKGLGSASTVSLAQARMRCAEARLMLTNGEDPIDDVKVVASTVPSFAELADEVITELEKSWRNPKHRAQWRSTLATYAKTISHKRVDTITTADVQGVLKPIWNKLPETAQRLRGRIEKILDAAIARGYCDKANPARWKGNLDHLLGSHARLIRGHFPAMPASDIPAFIACLRGRPSISALAVEFTILTAARSGETRGAVWKEMDVENQLWTIPPERMLKTRKAHRVPLTDRCMEILEEMTKVRSNKFIFPGQKAESPLSDMTLTAVLRRMGIKEYTMHGFRSSFRDWAEDIGGFPSELAEQAISHIQGNAVERAYRRGDALERRRSLMMSWEKFCDGS